LSGWWPQLSGIELWLIGAALIAAFAYINIRGLDIVAFGSVLFTVVILAPFAALTILGFAHWHGTPLQPFIPKGQSFFSSANLGLAVGVWMYSGYDGISTMAGEIRNPQRTIPRALMIIVPLVALSYIVPTLAGLAGWGHWGDWASSGGTSFVQLARYLGGPILGYIMLGAAVLSNMALYQDWMGPGSRPTFVMAQDRLLPKVLCKVHRKYGTPWVAILFLAAVNAVLIITTFANLVVIDIFLTMFYYGVVPATAVEIEAGEQLVKDAAEHVREVMGKDSVAIETRVFAALSEAGAIIAEAHTTGRCSHIVMGARGHGGFTTLLLGSTSHEVIQGSHCPVTIIRA
jgi:amino acid transporter